MSFSVLLFIGMSFHFFVTQFSLPGVTIVTLHCKSLSSTNEKMCHCDFCKEIHSVESNKKLAVLPEVLPELKSDEFLCYLPVVMNAFNGVFCFVLFFPHLPRFVLHGDVGKSHSAKQRVG